MSNKNRVFAIQGSLTQLYYNAIAIARDIYDLMLHHSNIFDDSVSLMMMRDVFVSS